MLARGALVAFLSFTSFPGAFAEPDKISVAYCTDCIPFHFQDEDGRPAGLIIDLWRLWSERTEIEIDFRKASWDETLRMVGEGEADAHAGLFFSDARARFLEYGSTLANTETHFFVAKDLPPIESVEGLAGHRVGVLAGDFVEQFLKERLPAQDVVGFENYEGIMTALREGKLQIFAADTPTGIFHLQNSGLGFAYEFPADRPLYRNNWLVAARKGNTELIRVIDTGMALITETERREIEQRWVALGTKGFELSTRDIAILAAILGIAAAAGGVIWIRTLRRSIELRTVELSDQLKFTEALVDTIPHPIFVKDSEVRYLNFNRAYEKAFGIRREDYIGETEMKLQHIPLELRKRLDLEDRELLRTGGTIHTETVRKVADGTEHDMLYWQTAFERSSGVVGGLVGVLVDISEQKSMERELIAARDAAETASQALEEAYAVIKNRSERMEDELNIAREIQMSMVPLIFPPFPLHGEFSIFATLEPAREVGGDFYDFYFIDEDRLCLCIGDVSGKGVPSALFMAVAKTLIKSRAGDDHSTASILTHLNDELSSDNNSNMFVTIFAAILNIRTGELVYTNAGHNPPYLKRADGTLQRLDRRHGPVIAAVEGMVYKEDRDRMAAGDLLLLYTDGVTEARGPEDRMFSEDRLRVLLASMDASNVERAVGETVAAVRVFEQESEQADDIAVLAVKFHGSPRDAPIAERRIVIKNRLPDIAVVNATFDAFAEEFEIPMPIATKFNLAFDELLNNVITFAYRDDANHEIEINIKCAKNRLTATIVDDGVPFNPLGAEIPDTTLSLADRDFGGLGIHLVRNLVDELSYQRRINRNVVTITCHLDAEGGGSRNSHPKPPERVE